MYVFINTSMHLSKTDSAKLINVISLIIMSNIIDHYQNIVLF